jgi:hypothetical protein
MSVKDFVLRIEVPLITFALWIAVGYTFYLYQFTDELALDSQRLLAIAIILVIGSFALFLTIGYFGCRAGYTKEELDKEAERVLSGRRF